MTRYYYCVPIIMNLGYEKEKAHSTVLPISKLLLKKIFFHEQDGRTISEELSSRFVTEKYSLQNIGSSYRLKSSIPKSYSSFGLLNTPCIRTCSDIYPHDTCPNDGLLNAYSRLCWCDKCIYQVYIHRDSLSFVYCYSQRRHVKKREHRKAEDTDCTIHGWYNGSFLFDTNDISGLIIATQMDNAGNLSANILRCFH